MKTIPKPIDSKGRSQASESLYVLAKAAADSFKKGYGSIHVVIQETGDIISIPKNAMELLSGLLSGMSGEGPITLLPPSSELTTQKAADMLNVSRPHVVKLLEEGQIPFKKVGTHRRILLKDLVAFRAKLDLQRNKSLERLAGQAQDLGLGY